MKVFLKNRKLFLWTYLIGNILIALFLAYIFVAYFLPIPDIFENNNNNPTTKIYDRHGVLLYEVLQPEEGKKSFVPIKNIPKHVLNATLAAEDINYYEHGGVDVYSLLRAVYLNLRHGQVVSGGSTITQQLVRNMLGVQQKRSYDQKIKEAVYALRLSKLYNKEEILELYLNKIYYGNISYGVETASLNYFNKHVYDLDLAEAALLAGIPQSPSNYNPLTNFDIAKKRQKYVLDQMQKYTLISQEEYNEALQEKLIFKVSKGSAVAPHFVQMVLNNLEEEYGEEMVHFGGLKITTTLDANYQAIAQKIAGKHVASLKKHNVGNAATMAIDVQSGQILTWLGSVDYFNEEIDGAVDMLLSLRQPGSSIKPFNYLLALEKGYTPATVIYDVETQFNSSEGAYTPQNYDLDYHGMVRLREALGSSLNIPAVKVLELNGVNDFRDFLIRLGFDSLHESADFYGLALTLGGAEVRLKNLAEAYLTLANYGEQKDTSFLLKVEDSEGKILQQWQQPNSNFILGENGRQHAFQIIDIMSDANARLIGFGEGGILEIGRPAAVKTGTTRNFKDNLTVGFTPDILVATWTGNADASPMNKISGVDGAAPIWHEFIKALSKDQPQATFAVPDKLNRIEVCEISGQKPTELCKERVLEWFVDGTEPQKEDNVFQKFYVNLQNGLSYNDCPNKIDQQLLKEEIVMVFPPELIKWALDHGLPMPPNSGCPNAATVDTTVIKISKPATNDEFSIDQNIPLAQQKVLLSVITSANTKKIEWYLDGKLFETVSKQPFSTFWPLQEGEHLLKAAAVIPDTEKIFSQEVKFYVRRNL